jgi:hypothetical protein
LFPLRKFPFAGLFLILLLLIFTFFCWHGCSEAPPQKDVPVLALPSPRQVSITIAIMGDFLMHLPVVYSVQNPHNGRFEFSKKLFLRGRINCRG